MHGAQNRLSRDSGHDADVGRQSEPRLLQGHDDNESHGETSSLGHDLVARFHLGISAYGLGARGGTSRLSLMRRDQIHRRRRHYLVGASNPSQQATGLGSG
jgi:hypothetical protein